MMRIAFLSLLVMTTTLLGCSQDDGSNKQAAKVDAGSTDATPQPGYEHAEKRTVPGIFSQDHLYGTLPNGLRFIVVPTDYPDVVSMQIAMQTGSRNEVEPGKSGFAHFFEHMMFRGTENYSQEEYQAILKSIGADTNAYTSDDLTNYYLDFTKEDLETVMEVEADRFQNLQYTEDQFRTEALAVKGEYLKNSANPIRQLIEEQRKIAYDTHTYQHTTMGFFEDIEQMPEQFDYSHEFFKRWYRPEFATLVVVGDVDARETYQLIEKYWGAWTVEGENNVEIPQEQGSKGPQYSHITWPSPTQPWVSVSFRGPAYDPTEKDMAAIDLISAIYFSSNSEIYRDLVIDKQWATSIGAYFPNRKDPGQLMVYAQLTDEKHGRAVMDRMLEALQQARTELVDADKLADTQSNLKYGFANNLDNSSAIASTLASYSHFTRTPVKTINNAYEQYGKLTAEDIRAHANEYFTDDTRVIVTLSASESMAGMNDVPLLDDMVAAAEMESAAQSGGSTDAWSVTAFRDAVMGSKSRPGKVSMVEMPGNSDLVNVSWLFNVGAARDPEGKKGLAELTARMIASGGSEFHDINAITEAFYPMAAGFGSQVGKEMTRFSGTVHKDNLDRWYAIAAEQLLAPGWRESDFQRIKQQLLTTISDGLRANNDEEFAKEAMYEFIYGDEHPYGSLTLGHLSDVKALTLDDVKLFYAKHYTPQNLTVGLAGGYSTAFRDHLLADLTALPNGDETQLALPEAPAIDGRQAMIIQKETQPVAVSFGFPIDLVRGDDDWVALWLVRSWLGEHRSSNSHLYQRIRATRGMNYGDYAYIEYFPRGMFTQSPVPNVARQQQIFQVWLRPLRSNNDAHFATRVALYELDKLLENGMSEQNFEATRDFLDKYVAQMVASQGRQLAYMLDSRFYGIDAFADYVRAGLQKLTLEDVNRVIGEHLQTENIKFVFISNDAEDLKARLVENRTSPMTYQAQQPEELLAEDQVIQDLDLKFSSEAVTIVPAEAIFD